MMSVSDILDWVALYPSEDFQQLFYYETEVQKIDHILQVIQVLSKMPCSISLNTPKSSSSKDVIVSVAIPLFSWASIQLTVLTLVHNDNRKHFSKNVDEIKIE